MDRIIDLYLNETLTQKKWKRFLKKLGLHDFSDREIKVIDHTIGLVDENNSLVGTGSVAGNILKYIGVYNENINNPGARFNKLITALQQYLFNKNIFHSFVFTKKKYSISFQHLHFTELAHTEQAAFLESGTPDIKDYLAAIPKVINQDKKRIGSIVMNANPFTKGHYNLVKKASEANDIVYVFVVATNLSLFSTKERIKLVKNGLKDLKNVIVVSGSDYMVSSATFPAYFLKSPEELIGVQTKIDARIFKNKIAPSLNISSRYLGQEPFSIATKYYNIKLKKELIPTVKVVILPRFEADGEIITATKVRKMIKTADLAGINKLVPATTAKFINQNIYILQRRIREGMNINGN